jgi:hypothetical protein
MATRKSQENIETIRPEGYVNNREITNLKGHFLVKGSKNVRIVNQEKVASSQRYKLLGAAGSGQYPIVSGADWKTNTGVYRNLRAFVGDRGELEVKYQGNWVRIKNGFAGATFEWVPYWLTSELIDVLVGVNGTDKLFMWSGAITEVYSATATTITKKKYYSNTTFEFSEAENTITDSDGDFVARGFEAGGLITVTGSQFNDGDYTIDTVTADTITLIDADNLNDENAGDSIVIKDTLEGTWGQARFLAGTSGRAVLINGNSYTYSGGEDTGTLTGLTSVTGVEAGDTVFQDVIETEVAALDGLSLDLVAVQDNHLRVASKRDRRVFMSANDDYTNFTYTTPLRKPGEGFVMTFDACPVALVTDENDFYVSAGDDDWYRQYAEFTADQGGESIIIKKLKTSPGQAALSQGAVVRAKNGIAFMSQEKTFDSLAQVENIATEQSVPISDDIKLDLEAYDLTGIHGLYHKRSIFLALPAEGLVLEYDLRFGYWQPPQELPVSRLAVIDGKLCGHSSVSNETYELYSGYNDNGAPFKAVAAFGYDNFGSRYHEKKSTEFGTELYATRNTKVKNRLLFDYQGATDVREFLIEGDDESITFAPAAAAGIGKDKLGNAPLGGTLDPIDELVKLRAIDTTSAVNFFERQRVFEAEGKDIRFEILSFMENVVMADNEPAHIKR